MGVEKEGKVFSHIIWLLYNFVKSHPFFRLWMINNKIRLLFIRQRSEPVFETI